VLDIMSGKACFGYKVGHILGSVGLKEVNLWSSWILENSDAWKEKCVHMSLG